MKNKAVRATAARRTWHRRARGLAIAFGIACMGVAAMWTLLNAHAVLLSSEPAAGSTLATPPARVRLVFSEALEPTLARVSLVDSAGHATPLVARGDPSDVRAIVASVATLAPGAYRVTWRVVSADGHPVAGSFVFSVGRPTATAPAELPPERDSVSAAWGPTLLDAPLIPSFLRGAGVGTLMAFAGLLLFLSLPRESKETRDANHASRASHQAIERLACWVGLAAFLLLAAHGLAWVVNASPDHQLASDSVGAALATGPGRLEVSRTALAGLGLWAIWLARRTRLGLCFAALAVTVSGATGHSAALHPVWAMPAKALHLLAASAWMGGLLWLIALSSRRRSDGESNGANDSLGLMPEAQRVSAIALAAVILVALSGVAQTFLFLSSPLDVVRSSYGAVVLLKVAGLAALIAFGAHHRFRVLPTLVADPANPRRFARTLRLEVLTVSIVVLLGGFLAYIPPPGIPESHSTVTPP